jgi:hypothetical protein
MVIALSLFDSEHRTLAPQRDMESAIKHVKMNTFESVWTKRRKEDDVLNATSTSLSEHTAVISNALTSAS